MKLFHYKSFRNLIQPTSLINKSKSSTQQLSQRISTQEVPTASSINVLGTYGNGDATITNEMLYAPFGNIEGNEWLCLGLDPNTSYNFTYSLNANGYYMSVNASFRTAKLTMATLPGVAMNSSTALLCAETNLDDREDNVGFEWRRYDAPSTMPSNRVTCVPLDGKLMGALSGLNPDVYYNYRPFFTSDSGNTYYGDWITFFTGDAGVYFDPTVRTYTAEVLDDFSAVLKGYALRGSDEIASQGFEYWTQWGSSSRAESEVHEVIVNGQRMTYTLRDLEPGTTYIYRTYVQTASGRTYGEEQEFTTSNISGIGTVIVNQETEPIEIEGYYNLQGFRFNEPMRGFNIVRYSNGTTGKIIVR